jgi:excisionase family DNA binding protein
MLTQGLLTVMELSSNLGVSPCTVYRWVEGRKIPFIRLGQDIRFRKEDVDWRLRPLRPPIPQFMDVVIRGFGIL